MNSPYAHPEQFSSDLLSVNIRPLPVKVASDVQALLFRSLEGGRIPECLVQTRPAREHRAAFVGVIANREHVIEGRTREARTLMVAIQRATRLVGPLALSGR